MVIITRPVSCLSDDDLCCCVMWHSGVLFIGGVGGLITASAACTKRVELLFKPTLHCLLLVDQIIPAAILEHNCL